MTKLIDQILEIHNSKISEDEDKIDSHIENLNQLILKVAKTNTKEIIIDFIEIDSIYYNTYMSDSATRIKAIDENMNTYDYLVNTCASVDKIFKRIVSYYTNEGFDPNEITLIKNYNNIPKSIIIKWVSKLKEDQNA